MSSSGDENESEATKILYTKSTVNFNKEFGIKTPSLKDIQHEKKFRELSLQVAEAEAHIVEYKKLAELAKAEAKELRNSQKDAFNRYEKIKHESEQLKAEVARLKEVEQELTSKKTAKDFLMQNCKSALLKYKTWYEHESKQTGVMRELLVDLGKWTSENRYKIYFSYKSDPLTPISDENLEELAQGSVFDYHGVDDIENLSAEVVSTKFLNNATQTDLTLNSSVVELSGSSLNVTSDCSPAVSFKSVNNNESASSIKMTDSELQFLDLREKLKKLEQENYLLKTNKRKRTGQEQQQQEMAPGGSGDGGLVEAIKNEQAKNAALTKKTVELEEQIKQFREAAAAVSGNGVNETQVNQTVSDPSVVFYHLRENPLSQAVKEYEEREAKRMKIDPEACSFEYQKYLKATEDIQKLQQEIKKLTEQKERATNFTAESARRYREIIRIITGYDIKMRNEEYVEMSSVYDPKNQFSFQKSGKEISVLDNKYAQSWQDVMGRYLPGSLPCFTAAVTLDLYNRQNSIIDQTM